MLKMQTGIHDNVSFEDYLQIRAVSNSYLGAIDKCPAKGKTPSRDSSVFALGRAFHTLTLEGLEAFQERYFTITETLNLRTKAGRERKAEIEAENEGKEVLTKDDCITVHEMCEAVYCHPIAREMLGEGVSEQTLVWRDESTGMLCKARPDKVPHKPGILIDLKSTASADPRKFLLSCVEYGYIRQAAMYLEGATLTGDEVYNIFAFIACEKNPPYRTEVFTIDGELLQWGRNEFQRLMEKEEFLRKVKRYPNYNNEGVNTLEMPGYLRGDYGYDEKNEE
jgi:exodeoxyribonuclease VIII